MPDCNVEWIKACTESDVEEGRFAEFRLPRDTSVPDAIPRSGFVFLENGTLRAYLNQCPHLGIELNWMPGRFMDSDNLFIQCSTHGALFKPTTGECIAGPCQGDALVALDLRLDHGDVLIRVPAWKAPE
ncbi:Rieske (2Fe-2S) protein [Marinobacter salinexigens]|uniref:Rieske (2Fe-2S) protein n=1 Tax=Marinobacter salinexigens TaxID=2919747 RepID=A0A5B0V826_9GAMM|nr:Rieske (2Fe-2S) protein [Marinobacter salinexigens]KAA1170700.1 Rieske (2Fe-2S) protein [Marinobacter salinexigens]